MFSAPLWGNHSHEGAKFTAAVIARSVSDAAIQEPPAAAAPRLSGSLRFARDDEERRIGLLMNFNVALFKPGLKRFVL